MSYVSANFGVLICEFGAQRPIEMSPISVARGMGGCCLLVSFVCHSVRVSRRSLATSAEDLYRLKYNLVSWAYGSSGLVLRPFAWPGFKYRDLGGGSEACCSNLV